MLSKAIDNLSFTYKITILVILNIFLIACSQISIPLNPVPITLQTLGIFLIASIAGPKYGTLVVISYIVEGIAGLPVFANYKGGIQVLLGPTGGYLLGFIFATFLIGNLLKNHSIASNKNLFIQIFLILILGNIVIYFLGILQLSLFVGIENSIKIGILPFIIGDLAKISFASLIIEKIKTKWENIG